MTDSLERSNTIFTHNNMFNGTLKQNFSSQYRHRFLDRTLRLLYVYKIRQTIKPTCRSVFVCSVVLVFCTIAAFFSTFIAYSLFLSAPVNLRTK